MPRARKRNAAFSRDFLEQFLQTQKDGWRYLDYADLLTKIQEIQDKRVNGEKQFNDQLAKYINQVQMHYAGLINELSGKGFFQVNQAPDQLSAFIQEIEDYALINQQALKNIILHHDDISAVPLGPSYVWKMQRDDFCDPRLLEPLLIRLSDLREEEREKAEEARKKDEVEKDSEHVEGGKVKRTAFERTSIKFWIKPEKIIKLVCAVLKHQSVYCYTGGYAQQTSSVYFDDEALSLYDKRLVKEEGAKLIRFRWYGMLTDDSMVFIERKVHHEKWVMEASVKERCTLVHHKIMAYINGDTCETEEYRQKFPLFDQVQGSIVGEKLKPILKTEYMRTAFQLPTDDSVRLTMDTKLNMLRELDSEGLDRYKDWHTPTTVFQEHSIHRFPFAVLEVKLHAHLVDNPPKWLHEIWNSDMLIRMDKFSKYNHGTAVLYPEIVNKTPYWFEFPEFAEHFVTEHAPRNRPQTREVRGASFFMSPDDIPADLRAQGQLDYSHTENSETMASNLSDPHPRGRADRRPEREEAESAVPNECANIICPCYRKRRANKADNVSKRMRIEPKTFFANERTYLQWFNAATLIATVGLTMVTVGDTLAIVGYLFLPISVMILMYSLAMYMIRTQKLRDREPSLAFADVRGPTFLTICLIVALIILSLHTAGLFDTPGMGPTISFSGKELLLASCSLDVTIRAGIKPAALTHRAQDNTVWGVGDGAIFSIHLDDDAASDTGRAASYLVPTYFGSAKVMRNFTGISFDSQDRLLLGVRNTPLEGPVVLQMDLNSRDIQRQYALGPRFPAVGSAGLRGLVYVPTPAARHHQGFFYVGNDAIDEVFIYDFMEEGQDKQMGAELKMQWQPMQGASQLRGLSSWGDDRIAVYFGKPHMVAVFALEPLTGKPRLDPVLLLYGFDLKSASALAVAPRAGQPANPAVLVASVEHDTVVSYNVSGDAGFTSCITYEHLLVSSRAKQDAINRVR